MFHPALDLAPNGVLAVEEVRIVGADEELAVGAVGIALARHRNRAAAVRRSVELGLEVRKPGPAHPGAGRIAGLRHESGDHPVEQHAVVKALLGEVCDPLHMFRSKVRAELDDDVAAGGKGKGQPVVSHFVDSPFVAMKVAAALKARRALAPAGTRP
jgi:hypothetical protein